MDFLHQLFVGYETIARAEGENLADKLRSIYREFHFTAAMNRFLNSRSRTVAEPLHNYGALEEALGSDASDTVTQGIVDVVLAEAANLLAHEKHYLRKHVSVNPYNGSITRRPEDTAAAMHYKHGRDKLLDILFGTLSGAVDRLGMKDFHEDFTDYKHRQELQYPDWIREFKVDVDGRNDMFDLQGFDTGLFPIYLWDLSKLKTPEQKLGGGEDNIVYAASGKLAFKDGRGDNWGLMAKMIADGHPVTMFFPTQTPEVFMERLYGERTHDWELMRPMFEANPHIDFHDVREVLRNRKGEPRILDFGLAGPRYSVRSEVPAEVREKLQGQFDFTSPVFSYKLRFDLDNSCFGGPRHDYDHTVYALKLKEASGYVLVDAKHGILDETRAGFDPKNSWDSMKLVYKSIAQAQGVNHNVTPSIPVREMVKAYQERKAGVANMS